MADPRFFTRAGPFRIDELAKVIGASLQDPSRAEVMLEDVMPLTDAGTGHLSFIDNRKYVGAFRTTKATAVIASSELIDQAPDGAALLVAEDPYRAYALAAVAFYPTPPVTPEIAETAVIADDAAVDPLAAVKDGAVIGADAQLGARTVVEANVVIGPGVRIGQDCRIGANAVLRNCILDDRVILHSGVSVGQDGFGFAPGPQGHLKVPQLGRVIIESDVEIGANTTIDRGAGPDTVIGAGSKLDNLVQIAHNVRIGRGCIIVSQVGISGSTHIGDFVMIGGQAGLTGHLTIGDGAKIAAQSGVMRDVPPGATVGGSPAKNMREWLKETAVLGKLAKT